MQSYRHHGDRAPHADRDDSGILATLGRIEAILVELAASSTGASGDRIEVGRERRLHHEGRDQRSPRGLCDGGVGRVFGARRGGGPGNRVSAGGRPERSAT